jgi:hypothetical protein
MDALALVSVSRRIPSSDPWDGGCTSAPSNWHCDVAKFVLTDTGNVSNVLSLGHG